MPRAALWRQLRPLDRVLRAAERTIALTERTRPLNLLEEQRRVLVAWQHGHRVEPRWTYAASPDLGDLSDLLESLSARFEGVGVWGELYLDRVAELLLEAELVRQINTAMFRGLAECRYGAGEPSAAACAATWAERWLGETSGPSEHLHLSDDDGDPESLLSALRRIVGARRLPVRVEVRADLLSVAAATEEQIFVRPGVWLRERDVVRIVAHEIDGHVVPRLRARGRSPGLFVLGTARAEDEEGRALAIEQTTAGFDTHRRRELAWRHQAALTVRSGASWVDTVDWLLDHEAPLDMAVLLATRCHRGGGLAREIVYLPALARFLDAGGLSGAIDDWMSMGRIGIDAAGRLAQLGTERDALRASEGLQLQTWLGVLDAESM